MTLPAQLHLVEPPVSPKRGELLVGVRLPGAPQVAQRHRSRVAWCPAKSKLAIVSYNRNDPSRRELASFVQTYMDNEYRWWLEDAEDQLRAWWQGKAPVLEPVVSRIDVVLPRPQHPVRWYTCRKQRLRYPFEWTAGRLPSLGLEDYDNLRKAAWDALVRADVLGDDRLIVRDRGGEKVWAAEGERPCVEIKLWRA